MKNYYFDYNSTTPVHPEALEAMNAYWTDDYANPSSLHHMGRGPYRAIREARRSCAALLNADEDEIVFTSGGTESNNAAILGALKAASPRKELLISSVEHASVLNFAKYLEAQGKCVLKIVPVTSDGLIDIKALEETLSSDTAAVSIIGANNETGVLSPLKEIAERLKDRGVYFHVDAVQMAGKRAVDVRDLKVDFLSVSAHKLYGPKGAGMLYVRGGLKMDSMIKGGHQEQGRRAGTENVPAIAGFGKACDIAKRELSAESERLLNLRTLFEEAVVSRLEEVKINGHILKRVPNTSNLCFSGIEAEALLMALDQKGICVSRGSACMSGAEEPSHVLKAMGLDDFDSNASMRFSFGRKTTEEHIQYLVESLCAVVPRLRKLIKDYQASA